MNWVEIKLHFCLVCFLHMTCAYFLTMVSGKHFVIWRFSSNVLYARSQVPSCYCFLPVLCPWLDGFHGRGLPRYFLQPISEHLDGPSWPRVLKAATWSWTSTAALLSPALCLAFYRWPLVFYQPLSSSLPCGWRSWNTLYRLFAIKNVHCHFKRTFDSGKHEHCHCSFPLTTWSNRTQSRSWVMLPSAMCLFAEFDIFFTLLLMGSRIHQNSLTLKSIQSV